MEYSNYKIYPKPDEIFEAFKLTPFENVRVVIIGQDPYPFNDHAHGLAFSSKQKETPASLQTILKEVDRDIVKTKNYIEFKEAFPTNNLSSWAKQGVLLLNSSLTVRAGQPNSHKGLWEQFIAIVLNKIWTLKDNVVFITWGAEAKDTLAKSVRLEDNERHNIHKILGAGHPATASKGKDLFSGCNHFSKINYWFWRNNLPEINWKLDAI